MPSMNFASRALVWALVVALAGCTTTRTADSDAGTGDPVVAAGDRVRVLTHDGRELEFTVDKVEGRVLVGHSGSTETSRVSLPTEVRMPFDEIARIEVKEGDVWKTAGLIAGTVAGLALLILLMFTASFLAYAL